MIRIIPVDDHAVLRTGCRCLLGAVPGTQVAGESASGIASSMHLSPKTVLNYLTLIRQKLNADNDFKLLHLAARHGLVDMNHAINA